MSREEPTYSESARGVRITRQRATQELEKHSITSWDEQNEILSSLTWRDERCDAGKLLEAIGY